MKHHLNTLYVSRDEASLSKQGQSIAVKVEGKNAIRVPLRNLESVVVFGWNSVMSSALMEAASQHGVTVSFLTPNGRFRARVVGRVSGNVLLRREQYRKADEERESLQIAVEMVAAKLANSRVLLLRTARESEPGVREEALRRAAARLKSAFARARKMPTLDALRGVEGEGAAAYFSVFASLLNEDCDFEFQGRVRYPATDPLNCLLSFSYALVRNDCVSAAETVGLDPAVGFLHRDRPGRPSLALDLMEELRPVLADRLALTLVNRGQLKSRHFERSESGAVTLSEGGRRTVIEVYQDRKREAIRHPFLGESVPWGLVPHLQARLLARHLRGDLDAYPAFYWK